MRTRATRRRCSAKLRHVPGIADLRMQQTFDQPVLNVKVDRIRATEVGLTQRDVANSLLVSLSGSAQVSPNFWVNPDNKVSYPLVAQTPQYRIDTLSDLENIPVSGAAGGAAADARRRWRRSRRAAPKGWSRTTTCSPPWTCTRPCRAAIWARSRRDISAILKQTAEPGAGRLDRGRFAARCRP